MVHVAVVLPTYVEAENLKTLVPAVREAVSWVTERFEVIVVDDDSPDGTADVAESMGCRVLRRRGERGLGSAVRCGMREALRLGAEVVVTMDADWQHNPRHIPQLVSACLEGADIALGSRRVPGGKLEMGLSRRVISWGAKKLSSAVLRLGVEDPTSGFRAYERRAAEEVLALKTGGYVFQVDSLRLARKLGLKVVEVPVSFESRRHGVSKLGFNEVMEYIDLFFALPWVKALQWGLGIAIMGLLLYGANVWAVFRVLLGLSPLPVLAAVACYTCSNLIAVERLRLVLKHFGEGVGYSKLLSWHMSGMLLSDVTPARSGYLYTLTMPSNRAALGSAIFLIEAIAFLLKVAFAVTGIVLLALGAITYVGVAVTALVAVGLLLSAYGRVPFLRDKLAELRNYSKKFKGVMLTVVFFTIVGSFLGAFQWYLIGLSLGIMFIPVWLYLFLSSVITTLSFIPISPAGVGVTEAGGVYVFSLLGLDTLRALAFMLLARGLAALVNLSGALRIVKRG